MFVKITVLAVVVGVASQIKSPCQRADGLGIDINCSKRWYDDVFKILSKNQTHVEERLKEACLKHSNGRLREVIETGRYKLTSQLTGYSEDDFDIKIRSNVLYFIAWNGYALNVDLAILPRFVDVVRGFYFYEDDTISIVFSISSATGVCDRGFGSVVATVPKYQDWVSENVRLKANKMVTHKSIRARNRFGNNNTPASAPRRVQETTTEENFPCEKGNSTGANFNCMQEWHDEFFKSLSQNQIWQEDTLKNACLLRSNARFYEVIETGRYKLTTKLSGYSEDDFEIKIKSNVLYFSARYKQTFNADLAILPRSVNAAKASYFYENNTLSIVFPINTGLSVCDRGFESFVKKVPKFEAVWGAYAETSTSSNVDTTRLSSVTTVGLTTSRTLIQYTYW